MIDIKRLDYLIQKGALVLQTCKPKPANIFGYPTVDTGQFIAWQTQTLTYLQDSLSPDNQYLLSFKEHVQNGHKSNIERGIGILKSIVEDAGTGLIINKQGKHAINTLLTIFDRFHLIERELNNRYNDRTTLSIADEYDVQDLLRSLLVIHFDDVRKEEWTPSYAGKSSRMDFLLKDCKTVVEVKKTRATLTGKEIGTQLIEDIARYAVHPDCDTLLCFVYDPDGYIDNPRGLENDLSKDTDGVKVRVFIRPV